MIVDITVCTSPLTTDNPHHRPVEFLFSLTHTIYLEANVQFSYISHAADYVGLREDLACTYWQVLRGVDTEEAVIYCYSVLHKLIGVYVPKRKV